MMESEMGYPYKTGQVRSSVVRSSKAGQAAAIQWSPIVSGLKRVASMAIQNFRSTLWLFNYTAFNLIKEKMIFQLETKLKPAA